MHDALALSKAMDKVHYYGAAPISPLPPPETTQRLSGLRQFRRPPRHWPPSALHFAGEPGAPGLAGATG